MNIVSGQVISVESYGDLSLIKVNALQSEVSCIIIKNPEFSAQLQPEAEVRLLFKETEVIIGKDQILPVSLPNQIDCQITDIKRGKLLSTFTLQCENDTIASIITSHALDKWHFKIGDRVIAMIKANEIMLSL
jgi:molybdopterin-binding protein